MLNEDFLKEIDVETAENSKTKPSNKTQTSNEKLKNKKKPKGGYRPVLVNEECLKTESVNLKNSMSLLDDKKHVMSDQDKVSYYIIIYLNQRYPNQLFENQNPIIDLTKTKTTSLIDNSAKIQNFIEFKNKNIQNRLNKLNIKTLFDLVNNFNLHSVPHSARFTLVNWYLNNQFKLVLFINEIPTSKDVLLMQTRGERCVSLIYDKLDGLIMGERDPLSFLLHDLVHAYKMFSNDYLLKSQIGFYRCMVKIINDKTGSKYLDELIENDHKFSEEFDYLISDMNSHAKHLFYYFKAILINGYKSKFKLESREVLNEESLDKFNEMFELFLDLFEMNDSEKDVARKALMQNDLENNNNNANSCCLNDFKNKNSLERFNHVDFSLLDEYFLKFY